MWKYKLALLLSFTTIIYLTCVITPEAKENKTVTHIVILTNTGDLIEHYLYKKNTACKAINEELHQYRILGMKRGYFVDYFFKCKLYEMIQ